MSGDPGLWQARAGSAHHSGAHAVDLADQLSAQRLEHAMHRAEIVRRLDVAAIHAPLASLPGRRSRALHNALATLNEGPQPTRGELEERFLALIATHDLPRARVNAIVDGHEVDFHWPAQRLIVETDGAAGHLTPSASERDRARDAQLTAAGYRVIRITWRQLTEHPHEVVRLLRSLLST